MHIHTVALIVMTLVSGSAAAHGISINADCNVHSDYDFALSQKSVILTRSATGEAPKTVLMRQGRLFIDDRWVSVSDADRDRLADYERQARATMPLARSIGRDAGEIAFTVLAEIARDLGDDPARTRATLAHARQQLDRELARSISASHFDGEDLGRSIGGAVQQVLPTLVGDITGAAVRAAFSGDSARFEKLDHVDDRIDAIIKPRAAALEQNARLLCDRMRALDALDDALDFRYGGRALNLLRVDDRGPAENRHDDDDDDDDRHRQQGDSGA